MWKKSADMKTIRHEANAHKSSPLLKVRISHGAEGYGVYFLLLELLALSRNCRLERDYDMIAYELHVAPGLVRSIVEDFGLFDLSDRDFGSESVRPRTPRKKREKAAPKPVFSQYRAESSLPEGFSTVAPQFSDAIPEDAVEFLDRAADAALSRRSVRADSRVIYPSQGYIEIELPPG